MMTKGRKFLNSTYSGDNGLQVFISMLLATVFVGGLGLLIEKVDGLDMNILRTRMFVVAGIIMWFGFFVSPIVPITLRRFVKLDCLSCGLLCKYSGKYVDYGIDIMTPDPIFTCDNCGDSWVINGWTEGGAFKANLPREQTVTSIYLVP